MLPDLSLSASIWMRFLRRSAGRLPTAWHKNYELGAGWSVQCDLIRGAHLDTVRRRRTGRIRSPIYSTRSAGTASKCRRSRHPVKPLFSGALLMNRPCMAAGKQRAACSRWTIPGGTDRETKRSRCSRNGLLKSSLCCGVICPGATARPLHAWCRGCCPAVRFVPAVRAALHQRRRLSVCAARNTHLPESVSGHRRFHRRRTAAARRPAQRTAARQADRCTGDRWIPGAEFRRHLTGARFSSVRFPLLPTGSILDEQEAKEQHGANKIKWGFKKTLRTQLSLSRPRAESTMDRFAVEMELDASQAKSAAEHGKETFVRFTAKVILMEPDLIVYSSWST